MTVKEIAGFGSCLSVKGWKVDEMFSLICGYKLSQISKKVTADAFIDLPFKAIKKETEKAALVVFAKSTFARGEEGEVEFWIPKTAIN